MSSAPHLDNAIIQTLQDVMEGEFSLLVDTFVNDSEERIGKLQAILGNGADADQIRRAAHSFKGSSSNIGATRLAELCHDIEAQAREGELRDVPAKLENVKVEFARVVDLLKATTESR